jgi:hypothetical protein
MHSTGADADIYTLNLATGERKPWTRFSPADKAATFGNSTFVITLDGSRYAAMIHRLYSNLFLASGLH